MAEGDCVLDEWIGEDAGTAGTVAAAEAEDRVGVAGALDFGVEDSAGISDDMASDVAGVGNTVVYNVFVTTRRDEVVMVVFSGARTAELEARSDETAELTGAAEGEACVTEPTIDEPIGTAPVELMSALLRVAVP